MSGEGGPDDTHEKALCHGYAAGQAGTVFFSKPYFGCPRVSGEVQGLIEGR